MLEQVVEIVGLHNHIVEFQEAQSLFHALLVALGPEHIVHGEAGAHIPEHFHIVQVQQPIGIVNHQSLALGEVNEPLHLALEAGSVVVDVLLGQHLAHIRPAGGIADHGGTAANQSDGFVAGHLQPLHQGQGHEMACGEAVGGAVKANIEGGLAVVNHFLDFFLVGHLGDEAAGNQFFIECHNLYPFYAYFQ